MTTRPILFSAPMVRAILDGTKTQTRRIVKPKHLRTSNLVHDVLHLLGPELLSEAARYCPYGRPGDQLWVRETFCELMDSDTHETNLYYAATDETPRLTDGDGFTSYTKAGREASPWKPSIYMPRAASRITLEVTGIRVERLQDITSGDAVSEGVLFTASTNPRKAYEELWESINGPGSWDANPFVWVIEFNRIKP